MICFFSQKKTSVFQKKLVKKYMFFMVNKTKQKLLFESYECFSKKEKKCQELIFAEDTYLGPPASTDTARASLVLISQF